MAYTTKGKSSIAAHTDAHGSATINYRHVRGKGTASVRGSNLVTDANNDDLAMTLVCDADTTLNTTPGVNQYVAGGGATGPVWLARAVVVATGTAAVTIYDNAGPAGTTTGNIIGAIPASATLGQQFPIGMPVGQGLSIINPAGAVQVALAYA